MISILVGIAGHHGEGLMPAHTLHRRQSHAGLYQVRHGGMPERMPNHLRRVQASPRHRNTEGGFSMATVWPDLERLDAGESHGVSAGTDSRR